MIIIIPIFYDYNEQADISSRLLNDKPIFAMVVEHLVQHVSAEIVVTTCHRNVLCYFQSTRISCEFIENIGVDPEDEWVPEGTGCSLTELTRRGRIEHHRTIMVVNFRNLFIDKALVSKAEQRFKQSGASLLHSVGNPQDHPAQYDRYFRIIDQDMIVMFDAKPPRHTPDQLSDKTPGGTRGIKADNGTCHSRPFYFNWKLFGVTNAYRGQRFEGSNDGRGLKIRARREASGRSAYDFILEYVSPTSAQRVLPHKALSFGTGFKLAGLSLMRESQDPVWLPVRLKERSDFNLYLREDLMSDRLLIRYRPIQVVDHDGEMKTVEHTVKPLEPETSGIVFKGVRFAGPLLRMKSEPDINSFYLAAMACINDDSADFGEPLLPHDELWYCDPVTCERRDSRTGKMLIGRQDFSEVMRPDRSIMVVRRDRIDQITFGRQDAGAVGFKIDSTYDIEVRTAFDLLKYHAKRKANALNHAL